MKTVVAACAIVLSCSFLAVNAEAAVYSSNYAPVSEMSEIDSSLSGTNNYHARALIAAARMGGKFFNNANVAIANQELLLLNTCKAKSPAGTGWPEGCNFEGLVKMMNAQPDFGKNWIEYVFNVPVGQDPKQQQAVAIGKQLHGLKTYKSPSISPVYGQVDHWVTIYEIETYPDNDAEPKFVRFLDACTGTDFAGNSCLDNMLVQATGFSWRNVFYMTVYGPDPFINAADKYYNSFLTSHDPPVAVRTSPPVSPLPPIGLNGTPMPGVLREGEVMAEWIAEERLWESLFLADVDQDERIWSALERGTPGQAWAVKAVAPSGDLWDYYLVPILDESGSAVALIRLSADDGAFEQLWIPETPRFFHGVSAEAAAKIAGEMVAADEELRGGELEWNAQIYNPYARSPHEPYYSFRVVDGATGAGHGDIIVRLSDGYAAGLEQSRGRASE